MKKFFVILSIIITSSNIAFSQDLYNYENSKKFVEYLTKSGQFELATREYERLIFMSPQNDTLKTSLLSTYRRAGKYDEALLRARQLYSNASEMPVSSAIEYGRVLLLKANYQEAKTFWESNVNLPISDKAILSATSAILQDNYKNANEILGNLKNEDHKLAFEYKDLALKAGQIKKKSPALAGLMSAIIPGSGRVYAKDWKDGLVSFLFVGTMAFQSYRGFLKSGTQSTRGWIYGGVALGFHLGNIYGSVSSAKAYNKKRFQTIRNSVDNLFNSYY